MNGRIETVGLQDSQKEWEMADEMFLCSTRAEPLRLLQAKYVFQHRHLEDAFKYLL